MYTGETECGVCYLTYNGGRRCPRELHCKHSFCESCLLAMSQPLRPGNRAHLTGSRSIICPLCRQATPISTLEKVRAELRVDESVLERLLEAGLLDQDEGDDQEVESQVHHHGNLEEEEAHPENSADESDSPAVISGGGLRRSVRKAWLKFRRGFQQPNGYLTSDDIRDLALMSCHMF
ncbi:uncharacterized protein KZ484_005745 [Pholidichthys leucotaenia]